MCHNRTEYMGVCVQVFDCHMGANQRWYIDTLARIHSTAFPDKCIDVSAGKGVAVTCSAALTQRFDQLGELFPAVAGSGAAERAWRMGRACWDCAGCWQCLCGVPCVLSSPSHVVHGISSVLIDLMCSHPIGHLVCTCIIPIDQLETSRAATTMGGS